MLRPNWGFSESVVITKKKNIDLIIFLLILTIPVDKAQLGRNTYRIVKFAIQKLQSVFQNLNYKEELKNWKENLYFYICNKYTQST